MTEKASYRKLNDHTHSSSTYHKKDGTAVRAIHKAELHQAQRHAASLMSGDHNRAHYAREVGRLTALIANDGDSNE